ncbi:MAG: hypothetical protein ACKPEA_09880 [Planctomycetota bacterium]
MECRTEWILPGDGGEGSLRDRVLQGRGLLGERERALFATPLPALSLLREPAYCRVRTPLRRRWTPGCARACGSRSTATTTRTACARRP